MTIENRSEYQPADREVFVRCNQELIIRVYLEVQEWQDSSVGLQVQGQDSNPQDEHKSARPAR